MIVFFAGTVGIVIAYLVFCPRGYQSVAQLFVRVGRESVGLDPTATVAQTRTFHMVSRREQEVASILEILSSRGMAEKVVNELGVDTVLDRSGAESQSGIARDVIRRIKEVMGGLLFLSTDPISDQELAVDKLNSRMDFQSPKETTVVNIKCLASTPELAQKMVATYSDVFLREHPRINRNERSNEFFAEQTDVVCGRLYSATEDLGALKNELGMAKVDGRAQILEDRLSAVETELLATEGELAFSQATVSSLKQSLAQLTAEHKVADVSGVSDLVTESMRSQLFELELHAKAMASKYPEDHPFVREARRQLEEAKNGETSLGGSTHILSAVFESQLQRLAEAEPTERALMAKREVIADQLAALQEKIKELNNNEVRLLTLQGAVDRWQASYEAYSENLEQARIASALEGDHISNINVVQRASLIQTPASPQRGLTLLLGLLAATAGSIALALVCEWLDHSIKSAPDVEDTLELPVVMTIPRVRQPHIFTTT